ncbi:MAG: hypothetical protein ABDH63_03460 [Candidatus Caldarchaeales archaeon]
MSSSLKSGWTWAAVLAAALALSSVLAVGLGEQSYFAYAYRLERADGASVSGTLKVTATELKEGSVRLRVELTFNDGVSTLEKNLPASAFMVPTLPAEFSPGSFSYSRGNYSFSVTVEEVGRAQRQVGGKTYQTVTYSIRAISAVGGDPRTEFTATVETIEPSRVIYALSASLASEGRGLKALELRLTDSNIDLASIRPVASSFAVERLLSVPYSFGIVEAGSGLAASRSDAVKPTVPGTSAEQTSQDQGLKVAAVGAAGLAAVAAVAALSLRASRRTGSTEAAARKPHYV